MQSATGYPGFLGSVNAPGPGNNQGPRVRDMLVVGATNKDGTEFFPSAQGDQVQVWAPGTGIRQASKFPPWGAQYIEDGSGTSLCTYPVFSLSASHSILLQASVITTTPTSHTTM